jgi:hypothetical protein
VPFGVAWAVLRRPSLWSVALRQGRRMLVDRWWRRRRPYVSPDYLGFRLQTQYGVQNHPPSSADVLNYLSWCKRQR